MEQTLQLSKDYDCFLNGVQNIDVIKMQFNNPLYLSGFFILINSEYDKAVNIFNCILDSYDKPFDRCIFIKKLFNKSKNLCHETRLLITKILISSSYCNEFILVSLDNCNVVKNAKIEQTTGPFCLMFLSTRIVKLELFDEIQNILVSRKELAFSLLRYFCKIAELNYPFVSCDEDKCYNYCSNDDFNMFILITTYKIIKHSNIILDDYTFDSPIEFDAMIGTMLNNLFFSKMRIKNILYSKKIEFTNNNNNMAVVMITKSIEQLEQSLDNIDILNFVFENIQYAVDTIDCYDKFENLCWFIDKINPNDTNYSNKMKIMKENYICDVLFSYLVNRKDLFKKIPLTSVMAFGLVLNKFDYVFDEYDVDNYDIFNKMVMNSVNESKQSYPIIKYTYGHVCLMKQFMISIQKKQEKQGKQGISSDELEFINKNFTDKCDCKLYLDLVYNYFIKGYNKNKSIECVDCVECVECVDYVSFFCSIVVDIIIKLCGGLWFAICVYLCLSVSIGVYGCLYN